MDTNDTNSTPTETTTTEQPTTEQTFTAAEVEQLIAHDRGNRQASTEQSDPIARFKATAAGTKLYSKTPAPKPAQPASAPESSLDRVARLMELQLTQSLASTMKPPAPPKPMSTSEKLASADPEIFLGRGPNGWTAADTAALEAEHAAELARQGFRGDPTAEAKRRAGVQLIAAGQKVIGGVKVVIR